jgi:hypothetical protein
MRIAKLFGTVSMALALTLALHTPASAGRLCGFWLFPACDTTPGPEPAPEIDPNLLRGAIAVLTGGVLMLAGRRRAH